MYLTVSKHLDLRRISFITMFIFFFTAHFVAARHQYKIYPWSWSWSELLINYQGGFVKRGLLGEIAYRLRSFLSPDVLIISLVFSAYIVASIGLIFALRLLDTFEGWLFLLSPTGWTFPLLNPSAYLRKDAFIVAALVISLVVIIRWRKPTMSFLTITAMFALTGLIIETALFFYPLVFSVFLSRWQDRSMFWRIAICVVAATFTIGFLIVTLHTSPINTADIANSWARKPYETDDTGALCCLNFTFQQAIGVARSALPSFRGYVLAAVLGLLPVILLWIRHRPRRVDVLTGVVTAAGIIAAMLPFVVAYDWGRYLYLLITSVFLRILNIKENSSYKEDSKFRADNFLIMVIILFLYSSTWQILPYPTPGYSAFIPGALFRSLGTPMSRLKED